MGGHEFDNDWRGCREYDHDFVSSGFLSSAPPAAVCVLPDPRSLVLGNAVSPEPPLWLSTVSMTFDFSDPGQCYAHKLPQESMTNTKSFTFKNRTYMAIVSVLAVPLVFHSWSHILMDVG